MSDMENIVRENAIKVDTIMNTNIEKGHAQVIALSQITVENSPNQELWGVEVVCVSDNKQYFQVCNSTNARANLPPMKEEDFHRMIVEFVVEQVKKTHKLDKSEGFMVLLMQPAYQIASMTTADLHKLYMDQAKRLMEIAKGKVVNDIK